MHTNEYITQAKQDLQDLTKICSSTINNLFLATSKETEGVDMLSKEKYDELVNIMLQISSIRNNILKIDEQL